MENDSKEPETTTAVEEQQPNAVTEATQEEPTEAATPTEESPEQINWRKFREEREIDRKAKEDAEKRAQDRELEVKLLTEAITKTAQQSPQTLSQTETAKIIADLSDSDVPLGGEVKKFVSDNVPQMVEEIIRKRDAQAHQEKAQLEQKEMPARLRREHDAFDGTVSKENLDYLDYHFPEVSETLAGMPESYDKWSRVYKMIKRLVPNSDPKDVSRMKHNATQPQSMGAQPAPRAEGTGGSVAPQISEAEKKATYERLVALARTRG